MTTSYWTQKNEYGGYEIARGNEELPGGDWINTPQLRIHRLCAVAWFGYDAVIDRDIHHRLPVPWLNVKSNLLPLPPEEHQIITAHQTSFGVREGTIEAVTEAFDNE